MKKFFRQLPGLKYFYKLVFARGDDQSAWRGPQSVLSGALMFCALAYPRASSGFP